jgi:hypothetical protein
MALPSDGYFDDTGIGKINQKMIFATTVIWRALLRNVISGRLKSEFPGVSILRTPIPVVMATKAGLAPST